jgi:hypothetical protein
MTYGAVAAVGVALEVAADRLGLIPASTTPRPTGSHVSVHQRGLHISVRESVLRLDGGGPSGPGSYAVAFNEYVTNSGTLPVPGVIVRPGRGNPHSGWVMPGTSCGVGDVSDARKFNSSQADPLRPITGELCKFKSELRPGKTTLVGYLTDFTRSSQATACAHAGAKVVTLTPRQTAAYAKKGFSLRGFERGTFGSPPQPSTSSPKTVSS